MGLDTSHGCWRGSYSAFNRWRKMLAKVAKKPPLDLMEGHCRWEFDQEDLENLQNIPSGRSCSSLLYAALWVAEQCVEYIPIPWDDAYGDDALRYLLDHSDCDGEIDHSVCCELANRLDELIPLLPDEDGGGHIGNWRVKTRTFADGLRHAAIAKENVEFG